MRTLAIAVLVSTIACAPSSAQVPAPPVSRYGVRSPTLITDPAPQGMLDGGKFAVKRTPVWAWVAGGVLGGALYGALESLDAESNITRKAAMTGVYIGGSSFIAALVTTPQLADPTKNELARTPAPYADAFRLQFRSTYRKRSFLGALTVGVVSAVTDYLVLEARQGR
jgi:hypothetical protein